MDTSSEKWLIFYLSLSSQPGCHRNSHTTPELCVPSLGGSQALRAQLPKLRYFWQCNKTPLHAPGWDWRAGWKVLIFCFSLCSLHVFMAQPWSHLWVKKSNRIKKRICRYVIADSLEEGKRGEKQQQHQAKVHDHSVHSPHTGKYCHW